MLCWSDTKCTNNFIAQVFTKLPTIQASVKCEVTCQGQLGNHLNTVQKNGSGNSNVDGTERQFAAPRVAHLLERKDHLTTSGHFVQWCVRSDSFISQDTEMFSIITSQ